MKQIKQSTTYETMRFEPANRSEKIKINKNRAHTPTHAPTHTHPSEVKNYPQRHKNIHWPL